MDTTIKVTFPIDDLGEVLEFVAKAYNDHNYSAKDNKVDYDAAITCKDEPDYDANDAECCFRRYNESLECVKVYKTELETLLEYIEKEHYWILDNLTRDDDFQAYLSWLNPNTKRYEHLEFDELGVASFYVENGMGMTIKKTDSRYGRDYHQVKFVTKSGESYYTSVFDLDDEKYDMVRNVYNNVYRSKVEEFMINLQTSKRLLTMIDNDED
jgi:hypothetical protein